VEQRRLMDVYLVRHAIAELRDAARWPDDAERPLSREGEQRFRSAARGLQRLVPEVEVVLSSPYVRAWHTAEILREETGWPAPERCDALALLPPTGVVEELRARAEHSSAALVGHDPHLSRLASLLVAGDEGALRVEVKKGAVLRLAVDARVEPGAALLRWSLSPKILRLLERGG
jgi:phosphohistidine phosphatase